MRFLLSLFAALSLSATAAFASSIEVTDHALAPHSEGVQVASSLSRNANGKFTIGSKRQSSTTSRAIRYKSGKKIDRPASMGSRSGTVVARVNLARQTMTVTVNGKKRHTWKISSGRAGYSTPRGTYRPQRLYSSYFSKKYDLAAMPYAVFYSGGFAVHGTYAVGRLGSRASHGCIRLSNGNARTFFELARTYGRNVKIVIS